MFFLLRKSCLKLYYNSVYPSLIEKELKKQAIAETKIKTYPKDKKVCLEAVKINGFLIKFVDHSIIDKELALEAVKYHGNCINYLPLYIIDKEICEIAIKNHSYIVNEIPLKYVDENMLLKVGRKSILNSDTRVPI